MRQLNEFIAELQGAERLSANTISNYTLDIKYFSKWLKTTVGKNFEKANTQDIKNFMAHLTTEVKGVSGKKGLAPSTVNRKLSSIQKAFDFLLANNKVSENPAKMVKRQKIDKNKKPSYMIEEEVNMLFNTIKNDDRRGVKKESKVRDYTIVRLMIATGLRVSEMCNIEQKDINFRKKTITIVGKGNKTRVIPISDNMIEIIKGYLAVRDSFTPKTTKLFVTKQGNGIDRFQTGKMIKVYCDMAGLDAEMIHAHTLRHTCATITYQNNGGDLIGVQQLLGHANIGTTQIYTHLAGEALRRSALSNPFA